MPLRLRLRVRVRTLVLAVAASACALGGFVALGRRAAEFGRRADFHHRAADVLHEMGRPGCMDVPKPGEDLFDPALRPAYRYHRDLGRRYSRAARRPWLPVDPGPPPAWAYPDALKEAVGGPPDDTTEHHD